MTLCLALAGRDARAQPGTVDVWIEPVGMIVGPVAMAALNADTPPFHPVIPVGVEIELYEHVSIGFEAALIAYPSVTRGTDAFGEALGWGGDLSLLIERRRLFDTGAFAGPRITLEYFPEQNGNPWVANILAGLDIGWEWRVRHFYAAVVLGAGVGVGFNRDNLWAGPASGLFPSSARDVGIVFGLNLNLTRVGVSF